MNNVPVSIQPMLCGSVHAKIFEILLIVGYILSIVGLAVNLVLTMYCFKYSYSIFSLEICLAALNIFCLIFAILLRVWRSNGSVNTTLNSASLTLSSVILVLAIIILLGSGAEDGLFYYTISFLTGDISKEGLSDQELTDRSEIFQKIFNKYEDMDDVWDKIQENKSKTQIIRLLPWISINFNALIQALSIFFIIIIRQRIKYKTDLESSQVVQTQVAQELNPNRTNLQRNSGTNLALSNNNANIYEDINLKKPKKRRKSKEIKENGVDNSDNVDIVGKKKGKKKKKKKSKSKDKAKRNSKSNIK